MLSTALERFICITSFALAVGPVDKAVAAIPEPEAAVVARLYKDFSWQAITGQSNLFGADLAHQRKTTLERYFSPLLAELLVRDAACQIRSQGVCNLDFDLLFDSQDPRVTDLEVTPISTGKVAVTFKDPVSDERKMVAFRLSRVAKKWKITDIVYGKDQQLSLLKVLSRASP